MQEVDHSIYAFSPLIWLPAFNVLLWWYSGDERGLFYLRPKFYCVVWNSSLQTRLALKFTENSLLLPSECWCSLPPSAEKESFSRKFNWICHLTDFNLFFHCIWSKETKSKAFNHLSTRFSGTEVLNNIVQTSPLPSPTTFLSFLTEFMLIKSQLKKFPVF